MKWKRILLMITMTMITFVSLSINTFAAVRSDSDGLPYETYTYWTELSHKNSKKVVPMRPLYEPGKVIQATELSEADLTDMEDVYCSDSGYTYVLDSKVPEIIVLDKDYNYVKSVTELRAANSEMISFAGAKSLYVTDDEHIFLCGTESSCVWVIDTEGNILETLTLPDSDIIPEGFNYAPIKVAVDERGYVYVLSDGSYYGAILYSPEGEFLGFYGANKVSSSVSQVLQNIYNRIFMNDIKKAASVKSLPFQFTDLDVGKNNFIYTTTGATTSLATGQLKILNPAGNDILDGSDVNYAGNDTIYYANTWKDQDISQLATDEDFLYVLDSSIGKIYLYDIKGNILGVFGGGTTYGDVKGTFIAPNAITLNGEDVLVLDKSKRSITIFKITEYGKLVKECQKSTLDSKYEETKQGWEEVLRQDANSQLAYRGLAKAYYREGDYKTAMSYAKLGADRDTYSQSFEYVREELIKANFYWAFPLFLLLIGGLLGVSFYIRKKGIVLIKSETIRHWMTSLVHPFDAFRAIRENGKGSVVWGSVLVGVLYATSVLKSTKGGFIYTYFDSANFNSLFVLVKTVGIVFLWTVVNWAVCTLVGGIGKMKEIYIVITYSTTPLIISNILYLIFTNVLFENEAEFLGIMVAVFWIYTIFMLMAGSIKIHDMEFGRFFASSLLTVVGIGIVIFLIFLLFLLIQQLGGFLLTLFSEVIYR